MKKALLLSLFAFSTSLFAQSIPNPGFETWTNAGSYEDPQGWGTYNFLSLYGNPITATKTTDAHSGTYAIRMESKRVTNNPSPGIFPDTIHTIYTGSTVPLVFGFPYTQKPTDLQLYFKSTPVNNSAAGVLAYLLKWNPVTHKRDTVAKAASYMAAATSYTELNVPFVYQSTTLVPDTAIIFTSPIAYGTPNQLGAVLFVDDISFLLPTGIKENVSAKPLIYQSGNSLTLTNSESPVNLTIYSMDGKLIYKNHNLTSGTFDVKLTSGVYSYQIENLEGTYTGKIAIVK